MNYRTYDDLSVDIKNNLYKIQDKHYDLIVGIPRSGMIPAYMIGLYLNVNVIDFDGLVENRIIKTGITRKSKFILNTSWDAQKILIVDDSIMTGHSMKKKIEDVPQILKHKITTLAIYTNNPNRTDVDIYFKYLSLPRVFEWNIYHSSVISRACVDIDGVLCCNPSNEENDDGEKYINFILNAKPLYLPTNKIHSIVTSRLEKYRKETELWLKKYEIEYENLIMLNLPTKQDRQKLHAHAIHKAEYYKKSGLNFFIESDLSQSIKIMEVTGKPVYCVDQNKIIAPNLSNMICKNPYSLKQVIKNKIHLYLSGIFKLWYNKYMGHTKSTS